MDKRTTWALAGAVAAGLTGLGVAVDRRVGTRPLGTVTAAVAALAYLAGTFFPRFGIFGPTISARTDADRFALTFDDGPDPDTTPAIARLLAERGHQATFFVLGDSVRAHPTVAAALVEDGHELASHGADHELLAFASPSELRRQISATEDAIRMATGALPQRLFRPPHGVRSPWLNHTVRREGYRVCAWDGSVFDTAKPGAETIAARVVRLLRPGAVVLLHDGDGSGRGDSRQQTVDALPRILDAAESRGLRSVCLSALVA
jgi:peptidoglycan-N-acetylglucosamine deacetylase